MKEDIKNIETDKYFSLRQENLYCNSEFLEKKWYRKLYGGKWQLLKFGRDTPYIGMFCVWTKVPNYFSGYKEVLETEEYELTGVDTKKKLFREFIKNIFSKRKRKPKQKMSEKEKEIDKWMTKVLKGKL